MMKNVFTNFLLGLLCVCIVSCEKMAIDESPLSSDEATIVFQVSMYTQTPLGVSARRSRVSVNEVCSRITYGLFQGEEKVKVVSQVSGDEGFGTLSLTLPLGEYQLVVVAHNGLGNATITSPDKITFPNNKCTNTFYAYQEFSVKEDTAFDISLKRAVALFRLVVEDPIPSDVVQMKFYYTGGSSTFNSVSGYGCVNSKQTEYRNVDDEMRQGGGLFDLYTFPHAVKDTLKMTVTALSDNEATVKERTFSVIPVEINSITQYSGTFFETSMGESDLDIHFEVDTTWVQYSKYHY